MNYNINTQFLPQKKSEYIRHQYDMIPTDSCQLAVASYIDACIVPLGYVEDACKNPIHNRMVEDLDLCADIKSAEPEEAIDPRSVLYCGYLHHASWGHFITNTLSRLWPIANQGLSIDKYVFITTSSIIPEITGNFVEVFRLLGIEDKIEIITEPKAYHKIYVGELSFQLGNKVFPEYVNLIKMICEKASHPENNDSRPVFFTRSALPKARKTDIGLDYIDRVYRVNGYRVIAPEKLTLTEMINIMSKASKVVFISGSGAHNSIFCAPQKEIHIIERTSVCNIFQPIIEEAFGHNVIYVEASYSLLPVSYGYGPFLYGKTMWFEEYAKQQGLRLPNLSNTTNKYNFKKYLKERERLFKYRWWIDVWANDQLEVFNEGYQTTKYIFADLIGGSETIYLTPLKKFLKTLLRR